MTNKKSGKTKIYGIILIFVAIALIGYGLVLDINNDRRLIDPVSGVVEVTPGDDKTVSITTVDGSTIIPKDEDEEDDTNLEDTDATKDDDSKDKTKKPSTTKPSTGSSSTSKPSTTKPSTGSSSTSKPSTTKPSTGSSSSSTTKPSTGGSTTSPSTGGSTSPSTGGGTVHVSTIDEANNNLRISIQNTYGIVVKYGAETAGYTVGGFGTTPLENSTRVNAALNRLKNAMALFPRAMFQEIRNGGIPLTVILIESYSEYSITGITESNYSFARISIAMAHPFEDSFYHEMYHYMERYMLKKGANFNTWNSLNPAGFTYGTKYTSLSYANTYSATAPFVNLYAQEDGAEDRASTFEYMMASSKATCLNRDMTVWKKAMLLKNTLEATYSSISPSTTEYWERYL